MGESFMGFPNRLRAFGSQPTDFRSSSGLAPEIDTSYDPNHALSSYYGYLLSKNYLNRLGGMEFCMQGDFYTWDVLPATPSIFNIGSKKKPYQDIYANIFHGTSEIAKKLEHKVNLSITGAVTGIGTMDGSEATVTINTKVNHNHDASYLKLTGGTMTGNITFSGVSTGINNSRNEQMLGYNPTEDRIMVGHGLYNANHGRINIYSYNNITIQFPVNNRMIEINGGTRTAQAQLGFSGNTFCISPTGNTGLWMDLPDGKLYYRGWNGNTYKNYEIYHENNLVNVLAQYLKLTGGTMTGQIQKTGVSSQWVAGRDNAMLRQTTSNGYNPLLSTKTTNGSWEFGPYTSNNLYLTYITDTNYNSKTNTPTTQYVFKADGTLVAPVFSGTFDGNISMTGKKNITITDNNNFMALKIWVGDDSESGFSNRYLHMSSAGYDGDSASRCFMHFDRVHGYFNSRVPFIGDNGLCGVLRNKDPLSDENNAIIYKPAWSWKFSNGVQVTSNGAAFIPTANNAMKLGRSSNLWSEVYAKKASINTSDRNLKKDIREISSNFQKMYTKLLPVMYYWKPSDDTDHIPDRQHIGFISQDVERALNQSDLSIMEFGGICIDEEYPLKQNPYYNMSGEELVQYIEAHPDNVEGINLSDKYLDEPDLTKEKNKQYGLRYEEFIALNTYMIQRLMLKIDELEVKLGLKEKLEYPELLDPYRYSFYDGGGERDE